MRLLELFDHRYDWTTRIVSQREIPSVMATFKTDAGLEYNVSIKNVSMRTVAVTFFYYDEEDELEFGITGAGDAFRVLSTVCAIIREYVDLYQPSILGFRASFVDGSSRAKVYDRMIDRMMPAEYRVEAREDNSGRLYTFMRNKSAEK